MEAFEACLARLKEQRGRWVVTGAAGFIGSNLVEALLNACQQVVGLDNFSTGYQSNLDEVTARVGAHNWQHFTFIRGDIVDRETCRAAAEGADYVLHNAALGSVPRSLNDPLTSHASNIDGTLKMLVAARDAGVRRFVYAGSSSTYGDHPALPKVEDQIGKPLSPYAVTKYVNELYADVFGRCYGLETIGLRYFNVFGPRQHPAGPYAAVIPLWMQALLTGSPIVIYGDGGTSRDFCYVNNVIQANLLAATSQNAKSTNQVYNIGVGDRTTLNELFMALRDALLSIRVEVADVTPTYAALRSGDVRHSQADIGKARALLGYRPTHSVRQGIYESIGWYVRHFEDGRRARVNDEGL